MCHVLLSGWHLCGVNVVVAVWTIGAGANEAGRRRVSDCIRDIEALFPPVATVYEYYVDSSGKEFKLWSDKLSGTWRPPHKVRQLLITALSD